MPRSLLAPTIAFGITLIAVAIAALLDTGGPRARDAALLIGTVALWAAAAAAVWLLVAVGVAVWRRRGRTRP